MARATGFMFDGGSTELRRELRDMMAAELPSGWIGPFTRDPRDREIADRFCRVLGERGLLVPEWPVEYGGRELDLENGLIIREEMWAHGEPRGAQYYGPNWIGPSIMQHGTEEQKALHLPAIAAGRVVWCQGFSEPGAGSDLSAMSTRAIPDGDGFRITGQKVWTSWAGWARWCYLLARVPAAGGDSRSEVTVFLVPMGREGIEVRPIDGLPGPQHLNEVFFDNVRVEASEVLGAVGGGWAVMRDALSHERVGIARYARSDRLLSLIAPLVEDSGSADLQLRLQEARIANRVSRLINRRTLGAQTPTEPREFEANAARLLTTRADRVVADLAADALSDRFFEDRDTGGAPLDGAVEFAWRYSRGSTIASGTTEMLQLRLASALRRGRRLDTAPEAGEMADVMTDLVTRIGGVSMARAALRDPAARRPLVATVAGLIDGLDPREDFDSALIAGELTRRAGRGVLPVPIEGMLLARAGVPLAFASSGGRLEHADLFDGWIVRDGAGQTVRAVFGPELLGTELGAFVNRAAPTTIAHAEPLTAVESALLLTLPAWFVLGALETALDLAVLYAEVRVQFGAPIAERQGVTFPLTVVLAELAGLQALAEYTTWRAIEDPERAEVDALALRRHAAGVAGRALETCHQVLGAIGLTYEHDLALITTQVQPRLRLPWTMSQTSDRLAGAIVRHGFASMY